ncbi:MAG TPA: hypothetical protein VM165_20070 [Planctomycetaceae bacterium]|nr:hypothetical protein [Planctomycetaceae bacterium]
MAVGCAEFTYEPFVWLCLNVPLFVIAHEQWIDVLAAVRDTVRAALYTRFL